MGILNSLKPGLDEKIYERALVTEFEENKINHSQQQRFPIYYKTRILGELIPDLIVDSKVIVDTKWFLILTTLTFHK